MNAKPVRDPAEPLRLADVKAGDILIADTRRDRLEAGPHVVTADSEGDLFIGGTGLRAYYLEHMVGDDGTLVGLRKAPLE